MTEGIDLARNALVAVTHDSLVTLRTALFRDVGATAAAVLQEAGYAGGAPMFDAFRDWLAARSLPAPESLPAGEFAAHATDFFRQAGWGSIELNSLESVATIDSVDWSESDPNTPLDFPGCYFTAGVFADFFGRVAGSPVAVMEVECRSMGNDRCRFLLGTAETLQRVYDEMGQGIGYEDAVKA